MTMDEARQSIIAAVDVSTVDEALEIIAELSDHVGRFKLGFEFIFAILVMLLATRTLSEARTNLSKIRRLYQLLKDGRLLLDCKLADIPNTMAKAAANVAKLGVWGFNFHASAGRKSIAAVVENAGDSLTFGVTVLTSLDPDECRSIFGDEPNVKVKQFAEMLVAENASGVICSAKEGAFLRSDEHRDKFAKLLVATPGIRPLWSLKQDQARSVTPHEAVNINGVTFVIIGRPITEPPLGLTRVQAAQLVAQEIAEGREITKEEALAA